MTNGGKENVPNAVNNGIIVEEDDLTLDK